MEEDTVNGTEGGTLISLKEIDELTDDQLDLLAAKLACRRMQLEHEAQARREELERIEHERLMATRRPCKYCDRPMGIHTPDYVKYHRKCYQAVLVDRKHKELLNVLDNKRERQRKYPEFKVSE